MTVLAQSFDFRRLLAPGAYRIYISIPRRLRPRVLVSATQTFSMRHQFVLRTLLLGLSLLAIRNVNAQTPASIRINEILADNSSYSVNGLTVDMLELYNTSGIAVDLGGCFLISSNTGPLQYTFPAGSVVPANGFYRMFFSSSLTATTNTVPFNISASGGAVVFYSPGVILIDKVEFGLQLKDFSLGRVADGTGPFVLCIPTFTGPNIAAALGSRLGLKVNEWSVAEGNDFVEIFNPTNKPVAVSGMYLSDATNNLTKYQFPINSYIGTGPMGGFAALVVRGEDEIGSQIEVAARHPRFVPDEDEIAGAAHGGDGSYGLTACVGRAARHLRDVRRVDPIDADDRRERRRRLDGCDNRAVGC